MQPTLENLDICFIINTLIYNNIKLNFDRINDNDSTTTKIYF